MKPTSTVPLALVVVAALAGCGKTAEAEGAPPAPAPTPTTAPIPTPSAATRALVEKPTTPTSPENLVVDPELQSLWTPVDETGFGIYEAGVDQATASARFEPETPAGPGVAVITATPTGAAPTLVATVTGGAGPLTASIWVSVPIDGAAPKVELASLYDQTSVRLKPDPASARVVGGAPWVRFTGVSADAMPGALYLVVSLEGKKPVRVATPEVLSAKLPSARLREPDPRQPATPTAIRAARTLEALRAAHLTMAAPPRQVRGQEIRLSGDQEIRRSAGQGISRSAGQQVRPDLIP